MSNKATQESYGDFKGVLHCYYSSIQIMIDQFWFSKSVNNIKPES